jgi:V/A-type H+-transporting ATPase subunit I
MIAPMKSLLLAGRQVDRAAVLSILQEVGVVHVEPVDPSTLQVPLDLLKEIDTVAQAIDVLSKVTPAEGQIPPPGTPARIVDEFQADFVLLTRLETDKVTLAHEIERVAPWGRIARDDLQALRNRGLHVEFFICPAGYAQVIQADVCQRIAEHAGEEYLLAISRTPIPETPPARRLPQPERDVHELRAALATVLEEEKRLRENMRELAKRLPEIRAYHQELLERKRFAEVETGLLNDGPIFVLRGWLPAACEATLRQALDQAKLPVGLQLADPTDDEQPPTKLENPWWCRPIEVLFSLLGVVPGYREADISPTFFPALIIFTAFLIGDAGYGLLAGAALAVAFKPLLERGVPRPIIELFLALFAGTFLYGVVTNTWFGEAPAVLARFRLLPDDPEAATKTLKWLCFLIGAVHLSIAHLWKIRRRSWEPALLGEIGWLLFIWPMYALVLVLVNDEPAPAWMLPGFGVSLALILLFTAPSWNLFSAIGQGLGAIALNAASFLSDIISYIRLWAVGLAGGILAHSFNELAAPLPVVLMVLVLVVAHLMNFALGLVALFAHGVRLNLLEFSNHLGMEWLGREFDPFRKRS